MGNFFKKIRKEVKKGAEKVGLSDKDLLALAVPVVGPMYVGGKMAINQGKKLLGGGDINVDNSYAGGAGEYDYGAAMEAQYENSVKLAELNYELTQRGIEKNIERFPELSRLAKDEAVSTGIDLNKAMKDAFEGALDSLYPEWREDIIGAAGTAQQDSIDITEAFKKNVLPKAMAAADEMSNQALDMVNSQLRGEIPDDVAVQLRRQAAEISQQIGVRGQAAQYLTARDLGRTSMDIQQQGLANAPAALGLGSTAYSTFTQTTQNPVATGTNITNLLKGYMAPQADIQGLYGTNQAVLAQSSMVPAGTAMQVGAQVIGQAGALAQQTMQSVQEYNSQQYWNQKNLELGYDSLAVQRRANDMAFLGSVIGAGAKIGAAAI